MLTKTFLKLKYMMVTGSDEMKLIGLTLLIAVTMIIAVSLSTWLIVMYPLAFGTPFIIVVVLLASYMIADTHFN